MSTPSRVTGLWICWEALFQSLNRYFSVAAE